MDYIIVGIVGFILGAAAISAAVWYVLKDIEFRLPW